MEPIKFDDVNAFYVWIDDEETNKSLIENITVTTSTGDPDNPVWVDLSTGCTIKDLAEHNVSVKSFSDAPRIKILPLTEDTGKNTWFVKEYEVVKDACFTGEIKFNGASYLMNICESNGDATVKLILEVDGDIKELPFVLQHNTCAEAKDHDIIIHL